ncbi:MAG: HD family phosphohydrolase [Planctomycetota bacterium]
MGANNKRSSHRLSFAKTATKADILARDQATSHRVVRLLTTVIFAAYATLMVGLGSVGVTDWEAWGSLFGVVLVVHLCMFLMVRVYHSELLAELNTFAHYFMLLAVFVLIAKVMIRSETDLVLLVPLPVLAMLVALIFSPPLAISTSLASATIAGLMTQQGVGGESQAPFVMSVTLFAGGLVAALGMHRIRNRTRLVIIGFAAGVAQFVTCLLLELWALGVPTDWAAGADRLIHPGFAFLNGLGAGILVTSALPFVERIFNVTTDIRLIELADVNLPLLRDFSLLAPGSWVHSQTVGQLAEEAARSIGANDLLARVGAYYHDIGKMLKPLYFVENVRDGENMHDRLSPEMSRLIIIAHVKDGIRLAQEEGLPKPIVDMIPMHHGTSVVEYFYHKKRQQEESRGFSESGQGAFQYPGPKPTFREAGILMLADSVEAISRLLTEPTPTRLRQVVRDVIQKKMSTGQLDQCELTVRDLKGIEDAFVRVLAAIQHGRIRYPTDDDGDGGTGVGVGPRSAGPGGSRERGPDKVAPPRPPAEKSANDPGTKGDAAGVPRPAASRPGSEVLRAAARPARD